MTLTAAFPEPTRTVRLPMRPCVGIMLLNAHGLVWIGRRRPKWACYAPHYFSDDCIWQMPQGGIDDSEHLLDAAFRELAEETGIKNVTLLDEIPNWLSFSLPPDLIGVALKGKYRGQRFRWFAMRFDGNDREIDIGPKRGAKAEFDDWRWVGPQDVPLVGVPFKQRLYQTVIERFACVGNKQLVHSQAKTAL